MPLPSDMPSQKRERVAVFLDYENVRRSARGAFLEYGAPRHQGMVDPIALAKKLCAKRARPSVLGKVTVYRGRPVPEYQADAASYFDRYRARWGVDGATVCEVKSRDLKYNSYDDGTFTAQEKGIDVWLATDLIATALGGQFDAVLVMSSDTDLLPAVEFVLYDSQAHIEVAAWSGPSCYPLYIRAELQKNRRRPYCHYLSAADFDELRQDHLF